MPLTRDCDGKKTDPNNRSYLISVEIFCRNVEIDASCRSDRVEKKITYKQNIRYVNSDFQYIYWNEGKKQKKNKCVTLT